MYNITTPAGETYLTEQVNYIRVHTSGVYLLTDVNHAEGVAYRGTPYLFADGAIVCEVDAGEMVRSANEAAGVTFVTLAEAGSIDPVTASEHTELFSPWACPVAYKTGNIRERNGKLYKCLQDHTSQETWTPEDSPSLWVGISDPAEEWPEWSQPVGSTDAYAKGAKVSHNGKHWTSNVDANVWEPGTAGTENLWIEVN